MNILHVIGSVDPASGGPIEGIVRQSEATALAGQHREIVSLDSPDAAYLVDFPIPVHAMGALRSEQMRRVRRFLPWARYGVSWRFVRWLLDNLQRYDVVVVNGLWNFTTLGFAFAQARRRVPYVVFTHGMLDPWFRDTYPIKHLFKQLFWLVADGRVVNGARATLFTSDEERRLARDAFLPYRAKERVIAYGSGDVPDDAEGQARAFRAAVPALEGRRYFLFLSRIHPKKGCDLLVEAYARLADCPYDLVIAGPDQTGWRSALESRAAALGIGARVHFPGMLQGSAKWGAFRGAEALVLPSHQENFGIVVAESMACGRPVLISDKVNIWREVKEFGGGLVAPDTAEGTERLLREYLALSDAERRRMSLLARACFETKLEAGAAATELIAVLRETAREAAH